MGEAGFAYVGDELELFANAKRWKAYFARQVERYLGEVVFEVGAGLGGTTRVLHRRARERWVCVEPDAGLLKQLEKDAVARPYPSPVELRAGTLAEMGAEEKADAILYMDVLEHIADDVGELRVAGEHVQDDGVVVILSPAHMWLYSPFDEAIGHHRRYTRKTLRGVVEAAGLRVHRMRYLDSVGVTASAANAMLLKQSMPTAKQIAFWDRCLVPMSRWIDPLLFYCWGKSVLCIAKRG